MKLGKKAWLQGVFLAVFFVGTARGADVDLWDSWRNGFETYEAAEAEFKKNNMDSALQLYQKSQQIFLQIRKASPEWNKEVITYRLSLCLRKINAIEAPRKEAAEEAKRKSNLEKLHGEIETLKKQLRQTRVELIDAKSAAERNALTEEQVKKLMSENSELSRKLSASNASISSLKEDLAKANRFAKFEQQLLKVKTDLERSNQEIIRLRSEVEEQKVRARKFQDQRSQAEAKLFRLEDQVKDLDAAKKKVTVLTGENSNLAGSLNSVSEKLKQSEQKLSAVLKKNEELSGTVRDLESGKIVSPSMEKLQQELSVVKKENAILTELSDKQKLELKTLRDESEKQSAENKKVVLELVKTTSSLAELRTEHNTLLKTAEEQKKVAETAGVLAAENAVLKKNIDEIAKKNEELLTKKKDAENAKIAELTAELNDTKANFKFTDEKLKQTEKDMKASAAKLQSTITALEEEKKLLKQSAAIANQENSSLKSALEKLTAEHQTLKEEFNNIAAALKKTEDDGAKKTQSESAKVVPVVVPVVAGKSSSEETAKTAPAKIEPEKIVITEYVRDTKKEESLSAEIAGLKEKIDGLALENAKLRVRTASFESLQKENGELREKIAAVVGKEASADPKPEVSDSQKGIAELKNQNAELEKAVAAAKEDARQKGVSAAKEYEELKQSVDLLKKQLITAQEAETKIRKEYSLLKMEHEDLEKKVSSSVSREDFKRVESELEKNRKELSELRTAKVEAEASLKASESLLKTQRERIDAYAKEVDPTAKDQISKLTATVTELQEAKIQYESTIRDLKEKLEQSSEDAKELRLVNSTLQGQVAELKVKPEEYLRKANDLLQKNMKLEDQLKKTRGDLSETAVKLKTNEAEMDRLSKDLKTTKELAERYRTELNEWGDPSLSDAQANVKKKDQAIDELVKETANLRKERDVLNTELTLSKDLAVKYKKYSKDIETKYQENKRVLARLKTVLTRHISGEEVEKLAEEELGKGRIAVSVEPQKPAAEPAEEEAPAPKLTPEQVAALEKRYKEAMESGAEAEKEENYSDALIAYWRASDIKPESPEARIALARVYLARKDLKNAADCYKYAVENLNVKRNEELEEKLSKLQKETEEPKETEKPKNP